MADQDTLMVWYGQQQVGRLWRDTRGAIGFRYEPDWIARGGFQISRSLPIRTEIFLPEQSAAHRWFANLLPEGAAREHIVRDLKLPNTDFDLLRAIGGECAGALSILPSKIRPSVQAEYLVLSEKQLNNLTEHRGQIYAVWRIDDRPRLLLAGAQEKCAILFKNNNYFLPQNEAPSSHILKFELPDYRHLPAYENFTTQLAGSVGLPVVDISLQTIGKTRYAQITRYDRIYDSADQLARLHLYWFSVNRTLS